MSKLRRTIHDVYPFISATEHLKGAASGKTVLLTGGGSGIGRAMARHFALAGAKSVIVAGRTESTLVDTKISVEAETPSCNILTRIVDVIDAESVERLFNTLGLIPDILINNAGVARSQNLVAESDPLLWWGDMQVSVQGTYLCTRAYLRLLAGRPGTILNVSSSVADMVAPNVSAYIAAKLAVNRFTECVQAEYNKQGVRCTAFHPGGIASTGMGQTSLPQFRPFLRDTVDLAAGTALYLSTDAASYLAGRFVYSNWDMERLEAIKDEIVEKNLLVSKLDCGDKLDGATVAPPAPS